MYKRAFKTHFFKFVFVCLFSIFPGCASPSRNSFLGTSKPPEFSHPLKKPRMTQNFRPYNGSQKRHWGMDFGGPMNTPIYAAHSGMVIYKGNQFSGFGNLVILETKDKKWASFYAHLNSFKVTEGQWIQKGDQLGSMGKTGRATGIHLHFEVRYNKRPIDPNVVLNKVKVSTQL